jgi:SH3 domain protein
VKRILLAIVLALPALGIAQTNYITDQHKITLRTGESTGHRVMRMLDSGTPVTVISRNAETGYTRVRLADGTSGYVLSRMLMAERPARERLLEAEQQLQVLRQEPGKLSSQLASLQETHDQLKQRYSALQSQNQELQRELTQLRKTAADPVRIARERDEAVERSHKLTEELEILKLRNQQLTDKTQQNWFLIGAGVIIAGIVIGLLLPHLRVRRKRSEWGDF